MAIGSGALTIAPATLSGSGVRRITGSGALVSPACTLAGVGSRHYTGTGALVAPASTVSVVAHRGYMASGALNMPMPEIDAETIVPDPTIWETDNQPWGAADFVYADNKPVMIIGNEFFQADRDLRFAELPLNVRLMRSGLTIMGRDRFGNWKSDPSTMKECSGIWPIIRGTPGQIVNIYIGAQESTEDPITWEGPLRFVIGSTVFCDCTVTGRYLAVRFESLDIDPWELLSYDLDVEIVGERA
jgi:hypothetical protein